MQNEFVSRIPRPISHPFSLAVKALKMPQNDGLFGEEVFPGLDISITNWLFINGPLESSKYEPRQ